MILLLLNSCFLVTTPNVVETPVNKTATSSGSLKINLSAVAPWLEPYTKAQGSNRAFLYATNVTINIQTAGGTSVIPSVSQTLSIQNTTGSTTNELTAITGIPEGSNYTVTVSIKNTAQSSWTMVSGSKTGVNIVKNTNTAVEIVCIPQNYNTLIPNIAELDTVAINGEVWYRFSSLAGQEYTVNQNGTGLQAFLFDSLGNYIGTATNAVPFVYTTPTAAYYYVGVAGITTSSSSNVLVSAVFPPANEGSVGTPELLTVDAVERTFKLGIYGATDQYSYYTFTTGIAGDYAIKTDNLRNMSCYLYSDAAFTTSVTYSTYVSSFLMKNLAAGITYYLKIKNNNSYAETFPGRLISPDEITLLKQNEGSISSPIPLTLSTLESTTMGVDSYDRSSYFTFSTGPDVQYDVVVSNQTGSYNTDFYFGTDSTFYSFSTSTSIYSGTKTVTLTPSTTYYLMLRNSSDNPVGLDFLINPKPIVPVSPIATTPDLGYIDGTLSVSGSSVWYEVTVPAPGNYQVNWNDYYQGDSTKTLDVKVSAYSEALNSVLFSNQDSAYSTYKTVSVPVGQTKFWLNVEAFSGAGTGTFGVKITSPSEGSLSITIR